MHHLPGDSGLNFPYRPPFDATPRATNRRSLPLSDLSACQRKRGRPRCCSQTHQSPEARAVRFQTQRNYHAREPRDYMVLYCWPMDGFWTLGLPALRKIDIGLIVANRTAIGSGRDVPSRLSKLPLAAGTFAIPLADGSIARWRLLNTVARKERCVAARERKALLRH